MATSNNARKLFATKINGRKLDINASETSKKIIPSLRNVDNSGGAILDRIRSKLIEDPKPRQNALTENGTVNPNMGYIESISEDTGLSVGEARGLLDALPDLELSKQIIVSSILSPNDMLSTDLIYGCGTDIFGDTTQLLVAIIKDYFDEVYKIKKQLPEMIGKAIFTDGCYPMAIFPETAIDTAINSNLRISGESARLMSEQMDRPLGILGNPDNPKERTINPRGRLSVVNSFESIHRKREDFNNVVGNESFLLTVTDNPLTVRHPSAIKKIRRNKILDTYGSISVSTEYLSPAYATKGGKLEGEARVQEILDHIYPKRQSANVPILDMGRFDRDDTKVGHPVVFTPPPEAVIPVYEPGAPHIHVGYFIVLDETGNPLSTADYDDQFRSLQQNYRGASGNSGPYGGANNTATSYANYKDIANNILGDKDNSMTDPIEAANMYASIVETELAERLRNGDYNEKHTIAKATRVYRMMFTRACQAMHTQLLYVPVEFMVYLAYDYKQNGVGKSLLEKTKAISSLRMINLMADSIASVKNSINYRKVDITLDPDDPSPMKTFEKHMDEFLRTTKSEFPIGQLSFTDITDSLQKAGVSVSLTGHPGVPETKMEVNTYNANYGKPDQEYSERLQKQNIMGLGIPPDSVNSATEMEFAKTVVTYNYLSAKINIVRQEITCEHLSDFMRKYTRNSSVLLKSIIDVIDRNREKLDLAHDLKEFSSKDLATLFANYIEVSLPEPDTSKLETEVEAFNKYSEALDSFLKAFISEEICSSELVGQEVGQAMTGMVPIIKAHFQRKFLTKHNISPELFSLVATGEMHNENFDILEQHEAFVKSIMPAMKKFIIRMLQTGGQADGVINSAKELLAELQPNAAEAGSYTDNSSDDSGSDEGDEGGSDDDMFGDLGLGDEGGDGDSDNEEGNDGEEDKEDESDDSDKDNADEDDLDF